MTGNWQLQFSPPPIRGGTDSPKMTKNQKCQCYQSFLGSVLYLKTGDDFSFCQKVRLTPCTGGPKILTVFGIFIDSGPLGEKQIDEQNGFILVVAVLFLQTDPQTAPRQHRRSLDTLQTPSRHPQDTLQTPSIANRRIKTSFYTLNLFQLLYLKLESFYFSSFFNASLKSPMSTSTHELILLRYTMRLLAYTSFGRFL